MTLAYVGHARTWDAVEIRGDLAARKAMAIFRRAGRPLAVVTIDRDHDSLEAEAALERDGIDGLDAFLKRAG